MTTIEKIKWATMQLRYGLMSTAEVECWCENNGIDFNDVK